MDCLHCEGKPIQDSFMCNFLSCFVDRKKKCVDFWEPNTRGIFSKEIEKSNINQYIDWKIKQTYTINDIYFYFVDLYNRDGLCVKKVFCLKDKSGKQYIGYPVNFIHKFIDYSKVKVLCYEGFNLYIDTLILNKYGEKEIKRKLQVQKEFVNNSGILVIEYSINIYWITSLDILSRIAKRAMFVEPSSGDIFLLCEYANDNYLSHEIVHCVLWNRFHTWPSLVFREGAAEAFFSMSYYRTVVFEGDFDFEIIEKDRLGRNIDENSAIFLGLFCKFLIVEYGIKTFYTAYSHDELDCKGVLKKVYGIELDAILNRFLLWKDKVKKNEIYCYNDV